MINHHFNQLLLPPSYYIGTTQNAMKHVFLLQNQYKAYLGKSGNWISEGDSKTLFRTKYKDEVINQKVEIAVKHPDLRIEAVSIAVDEKGKLELQLPKPTLKEEKTEQLDFTDNEKTHTNEREESIGLTKELATESSEQEVSPNPTTSTPTLETNLN